MTHLGYILGAYIASAVVIAGTIAWVALDLRAQKTKLARLEERGLRRRSEGAR